MRTGRRLHAALVTVAVLTLVGAGAALSPLATAATTSPACRTSQLSVWRGDPGSGAAGSFYYELEFSNVSGSSCSLYGFPGVSAVDSRGNQLGTAATRDRRFAPSRVVIAPGATAHAVLQVVDVSNFPPAVCQPTTAAALKIYPPNRTDAKPLPFRFRACGRAGPAFLSVRTIRPGAGIPGYSQ